jgi:large subunit ribosomal protein L10
LSLVKFKPKIFLWRNNLNIENLLKFQASIERSKMALSKEKKAEVVDELTTLLENSKSMQELRKSAGDSGTQIRVAKNRLVRKALSDNARLKDIDTSILTGQLMYAFNSQDEVAPAQSLANFAKNQPQIEFVGGINSEGQVLSVDDIKALASLPSKDQLRAQLVGTIGGPLSGFVNVLSGNVRGIVNVLNARVKLRVRRIIWQKAKLQKLPKQKLR